MEAGLISIEDGLISIESSGEHDVYIWKLNVIYCNFYSKYLITFKARITAQITAFVMILLKSNQKYKQ